MVLVHEMGGSLESWDEVAPRFAKSRRVLRYDTRGAGLSQKVRGELAIDTMADDIAALLERFGIAGKVALAGVAVGGAIALHFAARTRSAPAPSRSAAPRPASRRTPRRGAGAPREDRGRGHGVCRRDSMLNGYPRELRGDIKRFERYRARWLGNDPVELRNDLSHAGGDRDAGRIGRASLSGARDRRQSRSHAPATAFESRGRRYSRRALRSKSAPAIIWRCRRPTSSSTASTPSCARSTPDNPTSSIPPRSPI